MQNATYEKTMENIGNRIDVKLGHNEKDYLKCTSKPSYILYKKFDKNSVAIRKIKVTLKLKKRAYIGICILEFSKELMCKLYCDYIKNKNDNKTELLFSKADNFMYEIKSKDIYED